MQAIIAAQSVKSNRNCKRSNQERRRLERFRRRKTSTSLQTGPSGGEGGGRQIFLIAIAVVAILEFFLLISAVFFTELNQIFNFENDLLYILVTLIILLLLMLPMLYYYYRKSKLIALEDAMYESSPPLVTSPQSVTQKALRRASSHPDSRQHSVESHNPPSHQVNPSAVDINVNINVEKVN